VLINLRVLVLLASAAIAGPVVTTRADDCDCDCPEGSVREGVLYTYTMESTSYHNSGEQCGSSEAFGENDLVCGQFACLSGSVIYKQTSSGECHFLPDPGPTFHLVTFTMSSDGSIWTLNSSQVYEDGDDGVTADCDQLTVTSDSRVGGVGAGTVMTFTITVERKDCQELPDDALSLCDEDEGGDDGSTCPTDGEDAENGGTSGESLRPVAYLSGHKVERNLDLTIDLPGRNFTLVREYSSNPDLYHSDSGDYYWNGYTRDVRPGRVGVNWSMNVFSQIVGDHDAGATALRLVGPPLRSSRSFKLIDDGGDVRFLPRAASNQYILPETVDVPGIGSSQLIYRLREPGGVEYDFGRMPSTAPTGPNGLGMEDLVGRLLFERDSFGNTWRYEYQILVDNTVGPRDTVVLKSIYLNWEPGTGSGTWDARVDFYWNGIDYSGSGGPDYEVAQWFETSNPGVWDSNEDGNFLFGRLAEVRVVRLDDVPAEVETHRVRYRYFDDIKDAVVTTGQPSCPLGSQYDATEGDLCEVVVSELVDHDDEGDDYHERVWQYRYYTGGNTYELYTDNGAQYTGFSGARHQLLAVFYPEQIEYFADHFVQQGGVLPSGQPAVEAAHLLRWVSFDDLPGVNSGNCLYDEWEDFFKPGDHWQTLYDVASKVISYYPYASPDAEGSYRVRTQLVNSDGGAGCGCGGGTGIRLGKRFDYLYKRFAWEGGAPAGIPSHSINEDVESDGYSCQIVESRLAVRPITGYLYFAPYRVHAHDYYMPSQQKIGDMSAVSGSVRPAWKVATTLAVANPDWSFSNSSIEPPIAEANAGTFAGRRWVTMYDYAADGFQPGYNGKFNAFRRVARTYTPSATEWDEYVPSEGTGSSTTSPVLPAVKSVGLSQSASFSGGWRSATTIHEGDAGTGVTPTEVAYSTTRPDLVTQITRSPGLGPTGDEPEEVTTISYGYRTGSGLGSEVEWERRQVESESMEQNGPDTSTEFISFRLYDALGQLRWQQDAHGTLTYFGYDGRTGALTRVVRDANPAGSYVSDDAELSADFPTLSGTDFTAPSGPFAQLTDVYTVDLLGRVTSHTDPSGTVRYTRYEVLDTDTVDEDGEFIARGLAYMARVSLPYKLGSGEFDGPATVAWQNAAGKGVRTSRYIVDGSGGYAPLSGTYSLDAEVARSDTELLISGAVARSREWHTIGDDAAASGSRPYANAGSYVTSYLYDPLGRLIQVVDAEDGATEYQHDVRDRVTQVAVGVASWGGGGVLSTSVETVSMLVYDSAQSATQGVGNGNLTYSESYDGVATRATEHWYDFRDRRIGTQNPAAPHSSVGYDDLDRVVEQATFTDATGFGSGAPNPGTAAANRSTYTQTLYNNRGMAYRTRMAIDPTDDTSPEYLESNRWYDAYGLTIASWDPNGPGSKTAYDRLHRPSVVYQVDRLDDASPGTSGNHADASTVADNRVIEQTEYTYVAANLTTPVRGTGQAELITHRMRLHNATSPGVLAGTNSVATYTLYQFDDAARAFKTHAYGTNDTDFKKGTSAPNRPSTGAGLTSGALTSEVDFDLWGRQILSISPEGKKSFSVLDALSRQIAAVEGQALITADHIDLASGGDTWEVDWTDAYSGSSGVGPDDADRVTTFFYDGLGNITNRTAHLPDGSVQETIYEYGTIADSTPTLDTDSLVSSSRLLREVRYPNESTGLAGTTAYTVTYGYNRLGELRGMTDQNGTTHAYTRDALGRVTLDDVTAFGTDIDQAVHAIETAYDAHGRVASVVSLDSGDDPVNGVVFGFTPLHQIDTLTQHVSYTSGTPDVTGVVSYTYDDQPRASGSTGNYSRVDSITYPNEQGGSATVAYLYGADSASVDSRIGRVSSIDVPGWDSGSDHLVDYTYLGASTPVRVHYPSTLHGLGLDAIKAKSGVDGAATGNYPGFDKFGRVVHHAWVTDGFTEGSGGNPDRTPLLARAYEYDMDSNRKLDYDARPGAVRVDRDWAYLYDDLDRLKQADRGRESGGFTLAANSQRWDLDVLGNWKNFETDTNSDGNFAQDHIRTHNAANEIATIEGIPGSGPGGSTPIYTRVYDDAGNLRANRNTSGANRLEYTHDAWNRLVRVVRTNGPNTVLENEFNGLNHRIKRRMDLSQGTYDGIDEARIYFYSANWQVLEEWVDADTGTDSDSDTVLDNDTDRIGQQFWGVRYIDDAVARRVDRDGDGTFSGDPEDNFFYLTDVMFSVRAIVDGEGRLHTRLDYTPYGVAMHGKAADVNGDGALAFSDISAFNTVYNSGTALRPGATGYDPDADLCGSGAMDSDDYTAFTARYSDYAPGGSNPTFNDGWIDNPNDPNGPDNSVGYDGYWFDLAGATEATSSGLYMVRYRVYDPRLGRWLQRDPIEALPYLHNLLEQFSLEIQSSLLGNLYQYVPRSPIQQIDPYGLSPSVTAPLTRSIPGLLRLIPPVLPALTFTPAAPVCIVIGGLFLACAAWENATSVPMDPVIRTKICNDMKRDKQLACGDANKRGGCNDIDRLSNQCGRDLACLHAIGSYHAFRTCAMMRRLFTERCIKPGMADEGHDTAASQADAAAATCQRWASARCDGNWNHMDRYKELREHWGVR
jgi:RHS repeat-associated protein